MERFDAGLPFNFPQGARLRSRKPEMFGSKVGTRANCPKTGCATPAQTDSRHDNIPTRVHFRAKTRWPAQEFRKNEDAARLADYVAPKR